jgi:hypothetical protein
MVNEWPTPIPGVLYDNKSGVAYVRLSPNAYDHGVSVLHEAGIGGLDPTTNIDYENVHADYDSADKPLGLSILLSPNENPRVSVEHFANLYGLDQTHGFDKNLRRQVRELLHQSGIMVREVPPPPTATHDVMTGQPYQRR